jgi:hypothetical protein
MAGGQAESHHEANALLGLGVGYLYGIPEASMEVDRTLAREYLVNASHRGYAHRCALQSLRS